MTALLRLARPGEERAIAEQHVAAWRETYRGLFPDDYLAGLSVERRTQQWREAIADSESELMLVDDGGAIVGFAHAGPRRQLTVSDGELYAIYLLRSHQGLGLGRALVAQAARFWRRRGGATLALWVLRGNASARRFYERLGGVVSDHQQFSIGTAEFDEDAYLFEDLERLASMADERTG